MTSEPSPLIATALKTLRNSGVDAVIAQLNALDPADAVDAYATMQGEFYWKLKDLPAVVAISQAGIAIALKAADDASTPEPANTLRGKAKAIAYNLASFTWRGWDEPGITIDDAAAAAGMEAATLNLQLAEKLNRPAKAKANAHWAIGAHHLAARRFTEATAAFAKGKSLAASTREPAFEQMFDGYIALVEDLATPGVATQLKLDGLISRLESEGSDDAAEYARQLTVARGVL